MNCPKCYAVVPNGAPYCPNCGEPMQQSNPQENKALVFCPQCGMQNDTYATNCANCGAPIAAAQPTPPKAPQKPKKSLFKQKWFIFSVVGVVAIVLAVAIVLGLTSSPKADKYIKRDNFFFGLDFDGETKITDYEGKVLYEPQSDNVTSRASADGKSLAFIEFPETDNNASNAGEEQKDPVGTLYLIANDKCETIKEGVKSLKSISAGGEYLFYVTDADELCQYDVSKKAEYIVQIDKEDLKNTSTAISRNGKYLVYSIIKAKDTYVEGDNSIDVKETVLFSKGNVSTVSLEDFIPISVTNDGKSMYGMVQNKKDVTLYSIVNDKETKIDTVSSLSSISTNHGRNQLLYQNDGKTYLSDNFKEGVKIGNGDFSVLVPNYAYSISDFKDCFYSVEKDEKEKICYVNSKLEVTDIDTLEDYEGYELHGDVLYYSDDEKLYKVSKKDLENPEKIASGVYDFWCTDDGKYVYYTKQEDDKTETLYVIVDGKAEKLSEDVDDVAIDKKGNLFYISDFSNNEGDLYYCKGTKAERIDTGAYSLSSYYGVVAYKYDYQAPSSTDSNSDKKATYSMKLQKSGKNFEVLGEDLTGITYK